VTGYLQKLLAAPLAEGREMTAAEALARVLLNSALRGDRHAIAEVLDRVEGKPIQTVVAPTAEDAPRIIVSPVPIPAHLRGATYADLAKEDTDDLGDSS
jgi:hypothetical protein